LCSRVFDRFSPDPNDHLVDVQLLFATLCMCIHNLRLLWNWGGPPIS